MSFTVKKTLQRFADIWLFLHERGSFEIPEDSDIQPDKTESEVFQSALVQFNTVLDDAARVRELLSNRSLTARQVQAFMPISPRQVAEWDKRGILSCERETDSSNRHYSLVDLAWIEIIYKFQSQTFSKIENTSKKLRPLLDENILELCLLRDGERPERPVAIMEEGENARLFRKGDEFVLFAIKRLTQIIPVTEIMHSIVLKAGMLAGITSTRYAVSKADNHYKRNFTFDGKEVCFTDDFISVYHSSPFHIVLKGINSKKGLTFNELIGGR